jgi:hypothetical protein
MEKSTLQLTLFICFGGVVLAVVAYTWYHASVIATKVLEERKREIDLWLLSFPVWLWHPEVRTLMNSDLEFSRYVKRVEKTKVLLWVASGVMFLINFLVAKFYH